MTSTHVSGELARVVVSIQIHPDYPFAPDAYDHDDLAFERLLYGRESSAVSRLRESRSELQRRIASVVAEDIGSGVQVDPLVVRHGSIEILVVLSAVYMAVRDFNEVVDSVYKAAENIRRVCRDISGPAVGRDAYTSTVVTIGPALEKRYSSSAAGGSLGGVRVGELLRIAIPGYMVLGALLTYVVALLLR